MTQVISKNRRLKIAILVTTAIIATSIFAGSGCDSTPPIEISMPETTTALQITQVYIGGAVNNPGFYTLEDGDTIEFITDGDRLWVETEE
jgi:hypothetical protein